MNHPTDYGPEPSVASLQAEIFRLEGEIERLRTALRAFHIENERLREERDELLHMNQQYVVEIERLQAD